MKMRIVVPAGSVSSLAERLAATYGPERVAFGRDHREVGIHVADDEERTVLGIVEAVERWLDQVGLLSAEMWLGEHLYRLAGWAPETEARLRVAARAAPRGAAPRPHAAAIRHPRYAVARRPTSRRQPWVSA